MSICTRLSLCSALVLAVVSLTAAQQYSVTDLGAFPGGNVSQSQAINVVGQVAGYARFANFNAHGFLWTHKTGLIDLGSAWDSANQALLLLDQPQGGLRCCTPSPSFC